MTYQRDDTTVKPDIRRRPSGVARTGTTDEPKACGGVTGSLLSQAARFAAASIAAFSGNIALTQFLHDVLTIPVTIAIPIAMTVMIVVNFAMLRLIVFRTTAGAWLPELGGYIASIIGFRAMEYVSFIAAHGFIGLPYLPTYSAILVTSMACKFLFLRSVLFARAVADAPPPSAPHL